MPDDRQIDGVDIRAVFAGNELPERALFWSLYARDDDVTKIEYVIRRGDWKLMLDVDGEPQELYNLGEDPLEFFNVIESEDAVVSALSADARRMLDSIANDPLRPK